MSLTQEDYDLIYDRVLEKFCGTAPLKNPNDPAVAISKGYVKAATLVLQEYEKIKNEK